MTEYTKEELIQIASDVSSAAQATYFTIQSFNMGARCHSFLEFCGLMSKYADLCIPYVAMAHAFGRLGCLWSVIFEATY